MSELALFEAPKLRLVPNKPERVRYTAIYAGISRTTSVNLPELIS
jgi:hypothetical protein